MAVTVYVPTPFRRATGSQDRIQMAAADVAGLLEELERCHEDLRGLMRDEAGAVLPYINIYVNETEIEDLDGLETALRDGDEVAIIPAMAGGAAPREACRCR